MLIQYLLSVSLSESSFDFIDFREHCRANSDNDNDYNDNDNEYNDNDIGYNDNDYNENDKDYNDNDNDNDND